jgi:hypothetical protein
VLGHGLHAVRAGLVGVDDVDDLLGLWDAQVLLESVDVVLRRGVSSRGRGICGSRTFQLAYSSKTSTRPLGSPLFSLRTASARSTISRAGSQACTVSAARAAASAGSSSFQRGFRRPTRAERSVEDL